VTLAATPTPLPPRSRHSDALRRVLYFSGTAAKGRLCPLPRFTGQDISAQIQLFEEVVAFVVNRDECPAIGHLDATDRFQSN
jgi:hypothetical protein